MAELAFDPPKGVTGTSNETPAASEPPTLFSEPFDAPDQQEPVRSSTALAELHNRFSVLSKVDRSSHGRIAGALQRRLARWVGASSGQEHELLGALIRASDAIAAHSDELANRLYAVERHLEELMIVMSEELVQIRAGLASKSDPSLPASATEDASVR